jgi:hypothetical protein
MIYQKTETLTKVNDLFLREEQKLIEHFQNTIKKLNSHEMEISSINMIEFRVLLISFDAAFNFQQMIEEGESFYECKISDKDLIKKLQASDTKEYCRTMNYILKQPNFDKTHLSSIDDVWIEMTIDVKYKTNIWTNKYEPYLKRF